MKQSTFVTALTIVALASAIGIYYYMGTAPKDSVMNTIYSGGPLVVALLTLSIMVVAFIIERFITLKKAEGKGSLTKFLRDVKTDLNGNNIEGALEKCDAQQSSLANVIRVGIEKYKAISMENRLQPEEVVKETQKAIEEATMMEMPLLEKNLVAISTIASISTMVGLLGTVLGMIRSFAALAAQGGAPDAVELSRGISEALINTAGGLFAAIFAIVSYNFFTTKIDNFTYMIDEAAFIIVQTLSENAGVGRKK